MFLEAGWQSGGASDGETNLALLGREKVVEDIAGLYSGAVNQESS